MRHIVEAHYTISNTYIEKTQHACHVCIDYKKSHNVNTNSGIINIEFIR